MKRIRFEYVVVLVALLIEFALASVYDRRIVADDNCGSSDAAVCVESLFFLDNPEPMETPLWKPQP